MTIIAVSWTHIAADGMKLWGNEIRGLNHKKIIQRGDVIYAFAGLAPMQDPMIAWHQAGGNPEKLPKLFDDESSWTLLVIDPQGLRKYSSTCPYPEEFDAPFAIGAGLDMALGAMYAGASAQQAVEIVNAHCNTSGGEVQVMDIMEITGFTLKKPVPKSDDIEAIGGIWPMERWSA